MVGDLRAAPRRTTAGGLADRLDGSTTCSPSRAHRAARLRPGCAGRGPRRPGGSSRTHRAAPVVGGRGVSCPRGGHAARSP
ncbi:hypothetical protein FTX61_15030 [Nitriliruptoraceae bacterium ZYF776]|nr:hypothetical protein [Profundirhabdus halotolerans]